MEKEKCCKTPLLYWSQIGKAPSAFLSVGHLKNCKICRALLQLVVDALYAATMTLLFLLLLMLLLLSPSPMLVRLLASTSSSMSCSYWMGSSRSG